MSGQQSIGGYRHTKRASASTLTLPRITAAAGVQILETTGLFGFVFLAFGFFALWRALKIPRQ